MDLKTTLNLPKTQFPMRANATTREADRIQHWEAMDLYQKIQTKNVDGTPFIVHDGPPFTNGDVHIGTALNKILKDIVVRYQSMKGFRAPFVPGWDCHGLPIEHKVTQELRAQKKELNTPELRKACEAFSLDYIEKLRAQFTRLGILADWKAEYKTLDPAYEAEIFRTFATFVEKGLVYRSKKPVYWSIICETALAEAEIEYANHVSTSLWVGFKILEADCKRLSLPLNTHIVIWTTTPWTLPSNLAVAVHPEFEYTTIAHADAHYLVAKDLVESFAQACNLEDIRVSEHSFKGSVLEHTQAQHPFIDRLSTLVVADYVTLQSGTGCVHIAPGHGLDDYHTGLKYKLEIYSPIDDKGCYLDDGLVPECLIGVSILEQKGVCPANTAVIQLLKAHHALIGQRAYTHSYPYCWRSKVPVIYRAMDQWFVSLDHEGKRLKALEAIKSVEWQPSWGFNRIQGALQTRPDWCISRQRCWGVPLPVFYDETGASLLDCTVIRALADKIEQSGSQIWFTHSAEQLLEGIELPAQFRSVPLTSGRDTLDVWIDSGCSHSAVLKKNPELQWPADIYLEGTDQHRGWFQSSLWTSILTTGKAPYKTVITHGFVVDEQKKKISKSDNKPQTAQSYIQQFGVDILRLWIFSEDYKADITISDSILSHIIQAYRTIRNTLRFQLGNLYDFDIQSHSVELKDLDIVDQWALHQVNELIGHVSEAFQAYEFHKAYQLINKFCAVTLSATYHDILKDRLYTYAPDSPERRSSQTVIYWILNTLLRLLAPVLPFMTDEAFCYSQTDSDFCQQSIHLDIWPTKQAKWEHSEASEVIETLLKFRMKVNEQLEAARQKKILGQSVDAQVQLHLSIQDSNSALLQAHIGILPEIFIVSKVLIADLSATQTYVIVEPASGVRCPRSWRWVDTLVPAGVFGSVSVRCREALLQKYPELNIVPKD